MPCNCIAGMEIEVLRHIHIVHGGLESLCCDRSGGISHRQSLAEILKTRKRLPIKSMFTGSCQDKQKKKGSADKKKTIQYPVNCIQRQYTSQYEKTKYYGESGAELKNCTKRKIQNLCSVLAESVGALRVCRNKC